MSAGTWLLVFSGEAGWPDLVAAAAAEIGPAAAEAHHVLFAESNGPRWALLLVHWSEGERDRMAACLGEHWDYGFSNRVDDLGG